ncbi:MAG: hypothetical protein A2W91_04485 [Bacteroidetes bacterium GWF2_38_335]|nr:MAG: hypothetical protein A2W91_04485 [Bacteroidetes bacterium GWF2_38_335]HBS88235.1 hypothetical protein [Bacteroidales bacterium]
MKFYFLFLISFAYFSVFSQADKINVLFIGNSITYFNDMPQSFKEIADSKGDSVEVTVYAPGGTGFIHYYIDPNVYNYFREGTWDVIILQPGSNESPGYSYPISQTLMEARIMLDSAYKYNPCAKILYYEITYGIWGNTLTDITNYNNTMDLIRANLTYLADSTKNFFAPAGEVISHLWNENPDSMFWGSYGDIHPNYKGSYIIACAFYSSVFQKPSFGTTYFNSVDTAEAEYFQQVSDSIVLNHFSLWRINSYNQSVYFDVISGFDSFSFENLSENYDSLQWSFGNGQYSNEINPEIQYEEAGDYIVNLDTWFHGCQASQTDTIHFSGTEIEQLVNDQIITVWPIPAKDFVYIKSENTDFNCETELFNVIGEVILKTKDGMIQISNFEKGCYIVRVKNMETGNVSVFKIIKE